MKCEGAFFLRCFFEDVFCGGFRTHSGVLLRGGFVVLETLFEFVTEAVVQYVDPSVVRDVSGFEFTDESGDVLLASSGNFLDRLSVRVSISCDPSVGNQVAFVVVFDGVSRCCRDTFDSFDFVAVCVVGDEIFGWFESVDAVVLAVGGVGDVLTEVAQGLACLFAVRALSLLDVVVFGVTDSGLLLIVFVQSGDDDWSLQRPGLRAANIFRYHD